MTTVIDYNEIKEELVFFFRNSDIFTVSERNVTTTADTGTFSADSSYTINKTNVKNIRSIVIDSVTLVYGTDYTVDIDFLDSTVKCKISFVSAQTGDYTISYDYGTDIIFTDFPRTDLKVSSFPRMVVDIIGDNSEENELSGLSKNTTVSFSVIVYSKKNKDIDTRLYSVRESIAANQSNFYNLRYIRKLTTGPIGYFGQSRNNIKMRNVDFLSPFNIEYS